MPAPADADCPPTCQSSRLAGLQRLAVMAAAVVALVLCWTIWPHSRPWAVAAALALMFAHAPVMAFELALLRALHGDDPTPRAGWQALVRAWWGEIWQALRVFAWRQPFAWRRWPDTAKGGVVAGAQGVHAVVLVHGFVCNRGFWHPWMKALRASGVPYASVNLEPVFGSLDDCLGQLDEAVARARAATGRLPLLVCHSMGGLVVRGWMARDAGNATRVHRVVTIGTPHRGTWLARFSHLPNGRAMRLGSDWLLALEQRERAQRPPAPYAGFTCWYSNADNVVFPPATATLAGADNRLVLATAHVALAFHPRVMRESLAMTASGASSPSERTAS